MNPPKTKKLKTVPLPSILLYLIISLLGAWRFWRCLHSFFPNSSLPVYAGIYLLLCALLPVSVLLPRTTFAKRLEWIGSYWTCFQLTFCFAAILDSISEKVIEICESSSVMSFTHSLRTFGGIFSWLTVIYARSSTSSIEL